MRAAKVGAVSLMGLALLLTDSSLAWATLLVAVAIGATGVCISAGRPALAGVAGGGVALLAVLCVVTVAEPGFLSNLTARSNSQLHLTLNARTDAWESATHIWSQRPVLGYGPGASSVKLARRDNAVGVSSEPTVLGSAYGVWSASLIDAGVLGLLAWVVMFGAVAYYAGSVAMRQRSVFLWSVIAALTAGIIASQVGGDRLDLRVWLLMGLAVVASRRVANHPIGQERRI
jgi:O-antigen ligase